VYWLGCLLNFVLHGHAGLLPPERAAAAAAAAAAAQAANHASDSAHFMTPLLSASTHPSPPDAACVLNHFASAIASQQQRFGPLDVTLC
jgi:hypothetical protein